MSNRAARSVAAGAAATLLSLALATTLVGCGSLPTSAAGGEREVPAPAAPAEPSASEAAPGNGQPTTETSEPPAPPEPEAVSFTSNVEDGKGNVKVSTLVNVRAANGSLSTVSLRYRGVTRQGKQIDGTVKGALSADKTSWTATERLEPSSTYTLTTTGKGASGSETEKSSFRTAQLSSDRETYAEIAPQSGSVVGIGMPVVLTFDLPIRDRAAFEKNLHVESTPAQQGTWSWLSDTEVRYRPKSWWKPGTKIKAWADINGLAAGNGVYGQRAVSTSFTVSKKTLLTRINLKTHQARVYINGQLARRIPISAGKPGWATRSGVKLIMERRPLVRMTGESIGINEGSSEDFDLNVRYAMRITASGEYIHAAPWNSGIFGERNGSHGCVGMSTSNAIWLYNRVRAGDPVITTGSSKGIEKGNGWADWDVSYAEFAKGSAL
jgi:lipoprotein-anchoring transpeptidase ErfK/SrfK